MTQIVGDATHIKGQPLSGTLASGETWVREGSGLVPAPNEAYKYVDVDGTILTATASDDTLTFRGRSGILLSAVADPASGLSNIFVEVSGLASQQIPGWSAISGTAAGGSGIAVGGSGVAMGASGIGVAATSLASGGSGVAVGASGIAAGASGIALAGSGIAVGASGIATAAGATAASGLQVASGASGIATGASGMAVYASGKLHGIEDTSGLVLSSGNQLMVFQSAPSSGRVLKASGTNLLTDLYWGVDQTGSGGSGGGNSYAFIDVHGTIVDANAADDMLYLSGRSGIRLSAVSGEAQGDDVIFVEVSGLASNQIPDWSNISGIADGASGMASSASGMAVAATTMASGASGMAVGASGIAATAVTPDYTPVAIAWKDADEIYIHKGRYYKAGHRWRGQYQDLDNMYHCWDVSGTFSVDVDAVHSSGSSPGMIGGAKVNSSWYSVFLCGNTANDVLVLPYVRIDNVDYNTTIPEKTTITPASHNDGTTAENGFIVANDAWNSYRLVKLDPDLTGGMVLTIEDTVNGSPDQVIIGDNQVSAGACLEPADWLQVIPPAGTPCVYLGTIRIDASGNLLQFNRHEWRVAYETPIVVSAYCHATNFGNVEVGSAVPPVACMTHLIAYISSESASVGYVYGDFARGTNDSALITVGQGGGNSTYKKSYSYVAVPQTVPSIIRTRFLQFGSPNAASVGQLHIIGFEE
jgi:hypothetical protein